MTEQEFIIRDKKSSFRMWRDLYLKKYDILRINIASGDIDPKTNSPYVPITEAEKQWRVAMLNFTDQITEATTKADYPPIPERLL